MRLRDEFLLHNEGDDTYIIPPSEAGFKCVIRGNETLGDVARLLKAGADEEGIIRAILEEYDASCEDVASDVRRALEVLRTAGALADE